MTMLELMALPKPAEISGEALAEMLKPLFPECSFEPYQQAVVTVYASPDGGMTFGRPVRCTEMVKK